MSLVLCVLRSSHKPTAKSQWLLTGNTLVLFMGCSFLWRQFLVRYTEGRCHGTTSLFPFLLFSPLSAPCSISITFHFHLTLSTCLLPPLLQLQGTLMQLCYVHSQTSLRLTLDLLGPGSHAKGHHLYTPYNLSDPFFITNNG